MPDDSKIYYFEQINLIINLYSNNIFKGSKLSGLMNANSIVTIENYIK